jgi:hypothetical protein
MVLIQRIYINVLRPYSMQKFEIKLLEHINKSTFLPIGIWNSSQPFKGFMVIPEREMILV